MEMAHAVGARIDDAVEATEREALRAEGGMEWLLRAMPLIVAAQKRVEDDVEAGKIDLDTSKLMKDALGRVSADLAKVVTAAQGDMQVARGKTVGLRVAVAIAKQAFDVEAAKAAAVAQAEAEAAAVPTSVPEATPPRKAGQRPDATAKSKRAARGGK
jgi:hypothetical protein